MADSDPLTGLEDETTIGNADGKKLFCKYFQLSAHSKSNPPRALVFVAHGAGEHCLWYDQLASELTQEGCFVFAHDHVGHGQSQGDRVHVNDFSQYVRDVFQHTDTVKKRFPDLPMFIIGHSMGGTISILAALQRPQYFRGVVLIAPAIKPTPGAVSPATIFLGKIVAKVIPQLPVLKLDSTAISRDPAVVQKYQDDPLVHHGGLKARWGASFLQQLDHIQTHLAQFDVPFLALHGDADRLTYVEGSRDLAQQARCSDKTLKIYPGFYHQLHNEPGADGQGVRQEICAWIRDRAR